MTDRKRITTLSRKPCHLSQRHQKWQKRDLWQLMPEWTNFHERIGDAMKGFHWHCVLPWTLPVIISNNLEVFLSTCSDFHYRISFVLMQCMKIGANPIQYWSLAFSLAYGVFSRISKFLLRILRSPNSLQFYIE